MNLIELNNLIENTFKSNPLVKSYYATDPYSIWNSSDVKYVSISCYLTGIRTEDNSITYTFQITCADRLDNKQADTNFIYQNCFAIIEKTLMQLHTNSDVLDVSYPRDYQFTNQKFMDVLAVGFVTVNITVRKDIDTCK